jgi:hypothetical protein
MRNQATINIQVGNRVVTVKATDSIGPEDCYENAIKAVLHRYITGEDLLMPTPREVKDWIIRTNLFV